MTRSADPIPGDHPRLLTPVQVSDYLGIPPGTLANWRYLGRGPAFVNLGRHVRYRETDLTTWIESHVNGTDDQPLNDTTAPTARSGHVP